MKSVIKIIISIIIIVILGVHFVFQVSPKPGSFIINKMFSGPVQIQDKKNYTLATRTVSRQMNIKYKSVYKKNELDLYYPKNVKGTVPVVFWVHGGGYVGGDKSGMEEFAVYLAHYSKVAVVAINYELAPDLHYPGQVNQISEAYQYLEKNRKKFPQLDFSKIFFGGDSAGAQIAGQFVAIQTNSDYAKEMNITPLIGKDALKGYISYCGPLDLKKITSQTSEDKFMKFFVNTVAWALLGNKNWKNSIELEQSSLVQHITKNFPPSYVTDGNMYSFQEQGVAFTEKLKSLNLPVKSLFYKDLEKQISHEYQFSYNTDEAKECLNQTIDFISEASRGD